MNIGFRKGLVLMVALLIIIGLAACGGEVIDPSSGDDNTTNPQEPNNNNNASNVTKETNSLTFYYVDDELLEILQEEHEIQFSSNEEMWIEIWKALQKPQNEQLNSLWVDVELIEVEHMGTQLVVNLSGTEEMQLGSSGEGFAIQTLINTFGQIKGVETIQLLVDGEVTETLSGHVSIDQPFLKGDVIYSGG